MLKAALSPLKLNISAAAHMMDHPAFLKRLERFVLPAGLAIAPILTGYDVYKAKPEDRKKILIRDVMVLGATLAGTIAAVKGFRMGSVDADEVKEAAEHLDDAIKYFGGKSNLFPNLVRKLEKLKDSLPAIGEKGKVLQGNNPSLGTYKDIIRTIEAPYKKGIITKGERDAAMGKALPVEIGENFWDSMQHALKFFMVGGISVLSGFFGGMAADGMNNTRSRQSTLNKMKEGVFQFIANIALCAVGAVLGIGAVNIPKIANWLEKKQMTGKLIRMGIISTGLMLGIMGGGIIANLLGEKWLNPFMEKIMGKGNTGEPLKGGTRKIEVNDAILHVDDIPTALALAGMKVMELFIWLFFIFSGYRTGIGYRNDGTDALDATTSKEPGNSGSKVSVPIPGSGDIPSVLKRNDPVFQSFLQQRRQSNFALN